MANKKPPSNYEKLRSKVDSGKRLTDAELYSLGRTNKEIDLYNEEVDRYNVRVDRHNKR